MSELSTSDIVGLAVGIPSGLLALVGVVISFCAWKYPESPAGQIGSAIRHHMPFLSVRGGDARGGDAHGDGAHGGDARGGDAGADFRGDFPGMGECEAIGNSTNRGDDVEKQQQHPRQDQGRGEVRGGDGRGGDAYGQNVYGGSASGGSAFAVQRVMQPSRTD